MAEIERELERDRSTIRTWERMGWLPNGLEFHRDEQGWRYWDHKQLELVKTWMRSRNPGRTKTNREIA